MEFKGKGKKGSGLENRKSWMPVPLCWERFCFCEERK